MTSALVAFVRDELCQPLPIHITQIAAQLAQAGPVRAILFYGSNLRTGSTEGVLDFYVLTAGRIERGIWPSVSYREFDTNEGRVRAKIATMTLATFEYAAGGTSFDTTVWTRFVQPCALAWASSDVAREAAVSAVGAAVASAARIAAVVGPAAGPPLSYWRALFRQTYRAELRFEAGARADTITAHAPERYAALLPIAWQSGGIAFERESENLRPVLSRSEYAAIVRRWRLQRRLGKPFNVIRLLKAAFTFDGAARYAAWKIERHTGIAVPMTPWRERHPILTAPRVLLDVWRHRT